MRLSFTGLSWVLGVIIHCTPRLAQRGEPPMTPLPVAVPRPDLPRGQRHRSDPQPEAGG